MGTKVSSSLESTSSPAASSPLQSSSRFWSMSCIPSKRTNENNVANKQEVKYNTTRQSIEQNGMIDLHLDQNRSVKRTETKFCNLHLRTYTRVPINTLISYEEYRLPSHTLYLEHIPVLLQDIQFMWNKLLDDDDDSSNTITDNPVILPSTITQYKVNAEMYINKFVASGKYEKCLKQLYKKKCTFTNKTFYSETKKTKNHDNNSLQEKERVKGINAGNTFMTQKNNNILEEENNFLRRPFVLLLYKITVNNNHISSRSNNFNNNFYNKKVKKLWLKSKNGAATPKLTAVHLLSLLEMFLWNLPEPLIPFLISRQMENTMMHTNSTSYGGCTLAEKQTNENSLQNVNNKTLQENNKLEKKSSQCTNSEKQREQSSEEQQQVRVSLVNDKEDIKEWRFMSAWKEFANESSLYVNSYHTFCFIMAMLQRHINEITRHEIECVLQSIFHDASGECKHVVCTLLNECKPTTLIKSTVKYSEYVKNNETDKIEENARRTSYSMLNNNESVNATMGVDNDVNSVSVENALSKCVEHLDDNDNNTKHQSSEHCNLKICHNDITTIKAQNSNNTETNLSTSEISNSGRSSSAVVLFDKLAGNVSNNDNNNNNLCKENNQVTSKTNNAKINKDNHSQIKKLSSCETVQHDNIEEKQLSETLLNCDENEEDNESTKDHQESVEEHEKEETVLCVATNVKEEQKEVHREDKMSTSSTATTTTTTTSSSSSSSTSTALLPENCPGNENKTPDYANVVNKDNECNEQTTSELHSDEFVKMKTEQMQKITTPIINKLATFADEDKETYDNHHRNKIDDNIINNTIKVKTGSSISTNDMSKIKGNDEINSNSPIHRTHCRMTSDTMLSSRLLEHISPVKQIPHMNTNVSIEGEEEEEEEEYEEEELVLLQSKKMEIEREQQEELLYKKELTKLREECEPDHVQLKEIEQLQQRVPILEQKRKEESEQELKESQENHSESNQKHSSEDTKKRIQEQLLTEHKKLIHTKVCNEEQSMLQTNEENNYHLHNATKLSANANEAPLIRYDKWTEGKQDKRKQSYHVKEQTLSEERKNMSTGNKHKYRKGFAKMSDMHKMYSALQALEYAKHKFLISNAPLPSTQTETIRTKTNTSATQSTAMVHAINSYQRTKERQGEEVAENEQETNNINTQMTSLHKDNAYSKEICGSTSTPEAYSTVNSNKQQEELKETNKSVHAVNTHRSNSFATLEQEEKVNVLLEQLVKLQEKLSSDLARHANNTEREQSLLHKDKDVRFADIELRFAKMNKLLTAQVEETNFTHKMLERLQINMQKKVIQ